MTRSTSAGSNFVSTISSPPLTITGVKNAAPACDSGVHIRNGDLGHSHSANCTVVIVVMDCVVPMTPFGLPVVPPV